MSEFPEDYRDLNAPENFIKRNPEEQKLAAIYFLRTGAIGALNKRIALAREADPSFVLDLSGENLMGVDLVGADLRNADLSNADLRGASLSQARLTGANMTGVLTGYAPPGPSYGYGRPKKEKEKTENIHREKGQPLGLSYGENTSLPRNTGEKKSPEKSTDEKNRHKKMR